ncbi:MAG: sugar nucleotide-binding protein [Candidatus Eisenbacteria bacterium]|uniref:Sugar nucleotide-binding protein n=1 Tax=Eiseniibacteriota bacterium TaxID=2212470 RepID=A0A538TVJ1_UNCEI|nr:MAG: sugar nucleotide-binding protein [Candidatus Eisenbacteria bacterium]
MDRIKTSDLKTDAVRPAWSVLDTSRAEALGVKMRCWQEAVTAYLRSDHSPLARAEGTAHA